MKIYTLFALTILSSYTYAQTPSHYDLGLQKEGILDKNFKYTNSPKVAQLYQQSTAMINQSTPVELGDGVQMIMAMKIPSHSLYTYKLPILKSQFNAQAKLKMDQALPAIQSVYCSQVQKHIHYRVNKMTEKYIYLDENVNFLVEYVLDSSQC